MRSLFIVLWRLVKTVLWVLVGMFLACPFGWPFLFLGWLYCAWSEAAQDRKLLKQSRKKEQWSGLSVDWDMFNEVLARHDEEEAARNQARASY